MSTQPFKSAIGLTKYALACGYVQEVEICDPRNNTRIQLWYEGGPVYHVRAHCYRGPNVGRRFWETTESLSVARKFFDDKCKELFGVELKAIKKDRRCKVAREFHGESEPSYIPRFEGQWIGSQCSTSTQAWINLHNYVANL